MQQSPQTIYFPKPTVPYTQTNTSRKNVAGHASPTAGAAVASGEKLWGRVEIAVHFVVAASQPHCVAFESGHVLPRVQHVAGTRRTVVFSYSVVVCLFGEHVFHDIASVSFIQSTHAKQECVDDCHELRATDPFDLRAVIILGKALLGMGRPAEAHKVLIEGREIHCDIALHRELEATISMVDAATLTVASSDTKPTVSHMIEAARPPPEAPSPRIAAHGAAAMAQLKMDVIASLSRSQAACRRPEEKLGMSFGLESSYSHSPLCAIVCGLNGPAKV